MIRAATRRSAPAAGRAVFESRVTERGEALVRSGDAPHGVHTLTERRAA